MQTRERGKLRCQMFIVQEDGGTVWTPYKTLLDYGADNGVMVGSKGEHLYSDQGFPTRGAAVEATKRRAWDTIQKTFPDVRKGEVEWELVTEHVGGFVTV
ncbi:MAG: hypothetical protein ACREJU_19815 [Nitrospiraceae bacterium]